MMTDISALKTANAKRWGNARLTRGPEFLPVAKRLVAAKPRYQAVEARTGVPWAFIAVVHEREASQNFRQQLGQGDPLNEVSTHDPKGRGPFSTFEDGAVAYDHHDAAGFIKLNALRLRTLAKRKLRAKV